jgi:uncharacterized membrane protein
MIMTDATAKHIPGALAPALLAAFAACFAIASLAAIAFSNLILGRASIDHDSGTAALAVHVGSVIPAVLLGTVVIFGRKGTPQHKLFGRIWAGLMMIAAVSSFWLQSLFDGIGPVHILSVVTLVSIPHAIYSVRKGNMVAHQRGMVFPYIGLLIAGVFAFLPCRFLGMLVFG